MLVHSVWIGGLLSIVSAVFLVAGRRFSPTARYNVLLAVFSCFVAACGFIFFRELAGLTKGEHYTPYMSNLADLSFAGALSGFRVYSPAIVAAWFVIFMIHVARFAVGIAHHQSRVRSGTLQAPDYWKHKLQALANTLKISKTVALMESTLVSAPVLLGHLKPVILVPAGLLASLPPDQLEAVLLHELAHIRRNDYLVNLAQGLAEAVFFFNPGLLWISGSMRVEREHCSDDLALKHIPDRMTFVNALVSFKEYALYRNRFPLAFAGSKDQLFLRINRIVGNPLPVNDAGSVKALVYSGMLSILVLTAMMGMRTPAPEKAQADISRSLTPMITAALPVNVVMSPAVGNTVPAAVTAGISPGRKPVLPHSSETTDASQDPYPGDEPAASDDGTGEVVESGTSPGPQAEQMKRYARRQREHEALMAAYPEKIAEYHRKIEEYHQALERYELKMKEYRQTIEQYNKRFASKLPDIIGGTPDG
ncbi:M56 family metallopeptidase [Hufsiella ginkgonis]|nr:M56 family metallopeptidase [Hufsiella ginkgonis]